MFRVACIHVGTMQASNPSVASTDATAIVHSSKHEGVKGPDAQGSTFGGKALPSLGLSSAPRSLKSAASTSAFKGVTKHRSTGKYEAHLWDSSHIRPIKVNVCTETCLKLDLLLISLCLPCQFSLFADVDCNWALQKQGGRTRGKQIYLGGYDSEQAAARAYDVASLKFWGDDAKTNVSYLGQIYITLL